MTRAGTSNHLSRTAKQIPRQEFGTEVCQDADRGDSANAAHGAGQRTLTSGDPTTRSRNSSGQTQSPQMIGNTAARCKRGTRLPRAAPESGMAGTRIPACPCARAEHRAGIWEGPGSCFCTSWLGKARPEKRYRSRTKKKKCGTGVNY